MSDNPKQAVALNSVIAAVFLTVFKILVGILTGSLGIIAEAAHSALDLGASLITWFAVQVSQKPADSDHPFGHEKVESLSAFLEVGLLLVTCGGILWEAVQRLFFKKVQIEFSWFAIAVMVVSIIVDISRSHALDKAAKKYQSQALEADALHFASDIWGSLVVIVGLFCVKYGFPKADAIAGLVIALWVLVISFRLAGRTIDVLMDRSPGGSAVQKIADLAQSVPGIEEVHDLRVRQVGPKMFVNMHVLISRVMPFEQAHRVVDEVERKIQDAYPDADVLVHQEPHTNDKENIVDKIRMVANELQVSVHDITAHNIGGKIHINLDMEIDKGISFHDAHEIASRLENRIRDHIPNVVQVTPHLEPLYDEIGQGRDITRKHEELVRKIETCALRVSGVLDCHQVNLRQSHNQLIATLHCTLKSSLPLGEVHEITDKVEQTVLKDNPSLHRVIVHAEPEENQIHLNVNN